MAKKVKVVLDRAGVRELLRSQEALGACEGIAQGVAARAEGDWKVETAIGRNRAVATVCTDDKDTFYRNLHTNTLLKAMGNGGEQDG